MSVPNDRSDKTQKSGLTQLMQESTERLLRGLDYSVILLRYGEDSEEAREFAEMNPKAVYDREFLSEVLRDVFSSKERKTR